MKQAKRKLALERMYILINNAISAIKLEDSHKITQTVTEQEKEETLCPVCKNKLIFAEGCNICIDCGYSGCTSG